MPSTFKHGILIEKGTYTPWQRIRNALLTVAPVSHGYQTKLMSDSLLTYRHQRYLHVDGGDFTTVFALLFLHQGKQDRVRGYPGEGDPLPSTHHPEKYIGQCALGLPTHERAIITRRVTDGSGE